MGVIERARKKKLKRKIHLTASEDYNGLAGKVSGLRYTTRLLQYRGKKKRRDNETGNYDFPFARIERIVCV